MGEDSSFLTGTAADRESLPDSAQKEQTASGEKPEQEAVDAVVVVRQDNAHMKAEMRITAPRGAGAHANMDMLQQALTKAGVVYGIDHAALEKLAKPLYDVTLSVAQGNLQQEGVDGTCKENFVREKEKTLTEKQDGSVNYRELALITDVKAGTVICEITPPTKGADGSNVLGAQLKAREGKKAVVPAGENTHISADGLRLEAVVGGNLVFRNGRFTVETIYRVQDIDYDIGNITFSGDVIVNGDIQDGFAIHAGGDVTLRGRVGSVSIGARNITLEQGVNGTGRAVIEAVDTVKAGFIENCTVIAGKKVIASSVINSKVECEGDVEVTSKKGLICGGKITAFGSVKAYAIGNEFNTLTIISLGVTPKLLAERKKIVEQLADVVKHIESLSKNVAYIERLVADGRPVPPDRIQLLQRTQIQLPMTEKKREQLSKAIASMDERMAEVNNATLTSRVIYPPTKISIGALSTNCIETRNNCRVYRNSEGELVFGTA